VHNRLDQPLLEAFPVDECLVRELNIGQNFFPLTFVDRYPLSDCSWIGGRQYAEFGRQQVTAEELARGPEYAENYPRFGF